MFSFSLSKYLVTFMRFSVFSVISGVFGDSGESTWPYLTTHFEGEAEAALNGLKLCNDNYETAKNLLKERFGAK